MNINTIFRPMTVTQFQEMVEQGLFAEDLRLELIDGRIHEISPVGRIHSSVVTRLMDRMPRHFGQDYTYAAQNPVQLLSNFQPLPDYVVLRYSATYYQERLPGVEDTLLLIEVSDSTLMDDLTIKIPRYAEAGVREVWIIDVNSNVITQYHTPQEGVYAHQVRYKRGEEIPTTLGVTVPVIDVLG